MSTEVIFPLSGKRVWVAGHRGMVGSAISKRLAREKCELIVAGREVVNLEQQAAVAAFMAREKTGAIFFGAAKVGGIMDNETRPAEFQYDNSVIETNIVNSASKNVVSKLLLLGSNCIYPKLTPQPITEDSLLMGPLEQTNEWYAIAKIASINMDQAYHKQCGADFISAMPTNLYGPSDNFDLNSSHVMPALIHKAHEAKLAGADSITIWGTGSPRREFLHADNCADAWVYLIKPYSAFEHVNVGYGEDLTIYELARLVCRVVGFTGSILRDSSKRNGTPRKLLSTEKLRGRGWATNRPQEEGVYSAYQHFKAAS